VPSRHAPWIRCSTPSGFDFPHVLTLPILPGSASNRTEKALAVCTVSS
jgi:hypothetical protein